MSVETSTSNGDPVDKDEGHSLLVQDSREGSPEDDIVVHAARPPLGPPRRQSSFAQPRQNREPRTPNRVRFEIEEHEQENGSAGGHDDPESWLEEEDYMGNGHADARRDSYGQRAPLLTDIEAPSVTVANSDFEISPEELLERPKSGMRSAFMNMANSIM